MCTDVPREQGTRSTGGYQHGGDTSLQAREQYQEPRERLKSLRGGAVRAEVRAPG